MGDARPWFRDSEKQIGIDLCRFLHAVWLRKLEKHKQHGLLMNVFTVQILPGDGVLSDLEYRTRQVRFHQLVIGIHVHVLVKIATLDHPYR